MTCIPQKGNRRMQSPKFLLMLCPQGILFGNDCTL